MSEVAIRVEGLSKQYRIGGPQARYKTLRESLMGAAQAPIRRAGRLLRGEAATDHQETIWALKDVSFEVKHGEVLGVIGRNGAGKSTLLKILSRITAPTEGTVDLYGRVGSLLEVGTGFHPELTGRENIYLNGAILGMKRAEIDQKFDEMVDFAELEKFLDTPVKHYSSGMYVRLAFAVAAHLDPEILLVDEVLAVGDAAFQKKCLGKMGEVAGEGRTVLFVSHNMVAVQMLCEYSILLGAGTVVSAGRSSQVILQYLGQSLQDRTVREWDNSVRAPGNDSVRLQKIRVLNAHGQANPEIHTEEDFTIEIEYRVHRYGVKTGVTMVLYNHEGICVLSSLSNHEKHWHNKPHPIGLFRSTCLVPGMLLSEGQYSATVILWVEDFRLVCQEDDVIGFNIIDSGEVRGEYLGAWSGVVRPLLQWRTNHCGC